jgi:hypothetical protein
MNPSVKLATALALLLAANDCFACIATPTAQYTSPDELISRTKNIALAEVVRADAASNGWDVLYTFKTIKQMKGDEKPAFQILGRVNFGDMSNWRFNEHFDEGFWGDREGREIHDTACRIRPGFTVGGTYLVFMDQPYHTKSFEMILMTEGDADKKDKWLQYVEKRTGHQESAGD